MKYAVCLLFSDDLKQVCLILKKRPPWQAGLCNGPGGKLEGEETSLAGAIREFFEETGVQGIDWKMLVTQRGIGKMAAGITYDVDYFVAKSSKDLALVQSNTDEVIGIFSTAELPSLVSSLEWIIPLAMYALAGRMESELIFVRW